MAIEKLPLGVILAGGQSSRMGGGDKPLASVGGRTLLNRVIHRMRAQCGGLVLNANGDPARFADYGLPIIADEIEGFAGPLAGILAGMDWAAKNRPEITDIVSLPADCPFLPDDLVGMLLAARADAGLRLACAASGGWAHPVIAVWPVAMRYDLFDALVAGERKIDRFTARFGVAQAVWSTDPFDPFFNANSPDDLAAANALAAEHPDA